MKIIKTFIKDLVVIQPTVYNDDRGYFFESYNQEKLAVLKTTFIQDNESKSQKNVLRGLHFQKPPYAQAKLVRVSKGAVIDVAVDLRKNSVTYGKHFAIKLTSKNKKQLFVPKGFAHGFLTLKNNTIFNYKCDAYYHKESEVTLNCFDELLAINWKKKKVLLSKKDKNAITFTNFKTPFK